MFLVQSTQIAKTPPVTHRTDRPDHELTVVIPAFNEERRLPATLQELKAFLDRTNIDYRVVVADDGSSDGTPRLAAECGQRFSTISLPRNEGKGAAVRAGMLAATGQWVAFMDADLPFSLDCLLRARHVLANGQADVVFGWRNMVAGERPVYCSLLRRTASAMFQRLMRWLISRDVTDTQAGFKAFRREAARRIFSRATLNGFAFDAEVVFLVTRWKIAYRKLPVVLVNNESSTVSILRHAAPMLLDVLRVIVRGWQGKYDVPGEASSADLPAPFENTWARIAA